LLSLRFVCLCTCLSFCLCAVTDLWTAGQRIDPSSNSTFVWRTSNTYTTVSAMPYTNWLSGQPNNIVVSSNRACISTVLILTDGMMALAAVHFFLSANLTYDNNMNVYDIWIVEKPKTNDISVVEEPKTILRRNLETKTFKVITRNSAIADRSHSVS